jgi:hypothetical protein
MDILEWRKPTLSIYHEKPAAKESEPFVVIKAQKLTVNSTETNRIKGNIQDFFVLMGDLDYISSSEGKNEKYVLCWFDDAIDDFQQAFRKLNGVTFPTTITHSIVNQKKSYMASIQAESGKLQ